MLGQETNKGMSGNISALPHCLAGVRYKDESQQRGYLSLDGTKKTLVQVTGG